MNHSNQYVNTYKEPYNEGNYDLPVQMVNSEMPMPHYTAMDERIHRRPFGFGRPFFGGPFGFGFGAPFFGGFLGGLAASTLAGPFGYAVYPYYPFGGFWY